MCIRGRVTGATFTQRVTGFIALFYIGYHVWTQRFAGVHLPTHPGAAFWKVQHELSNPWILAFYVIAMVATCWHFAYGVWLFAAKWGITPGNSARKKFGWVCAAGGTALCLMGLIAIYAVVWKYPNAPEDVMPEQPAGVVMPAPQSAPPGSVNPQPAGRGAVMLHGASPTHPVFLILGLGAFLFFGLLGARKIEDWRKTEGFAPAPSSTRQGNSEYKRLLWRSMPLELKKQVRIFWAIGFSSAVLGIWLAG